MTNRKINYIIIRKEERQKIIKLWPVLVSLSSCFHRSISDKRGTKTSQRFFNYFSLLAKFLNIYIFFFEFSFMTTVSFFLLFRVHFPRFNKYVWFYSNTYWFTLKLSISHIFISEKHIAFAYTEACVCVEANYGKYANTLAMKQSHYY